MCKEYTCFNENDYKIFKYVDDYFCNLAKENFGASEIYVPSIISESVLKRCNYITSFPQQLTIASYMNVGNSNEDNKIINSNFYFTPAACLHLYPMLDGKNNNNKTYTMRTQVYRHEQEEFDGKTRLWNFSVREIVFVGSESYVKSSLVKFEKYVIDTIKKLNLNCKVELASDHFYPSRENAIKKKIQLSNSLKKELVCDINGKNISIASFNFHGFHFSKSFNFDLNSTIVTGCIGFGLERWFNVLKDKITKIKTIFQIYEESRKKGLIYKLIESNLLFKDEKQNLEYEIKIKINNLQMEQALNQINGLLSTNEYFVDNISEYTETDVSYFIDKENNEYSLFLYKGNVLLKTKVHNIVPFEGIKVFKSNEKFENNSEIIKYILSNSSIKYVGEQVKKRIKNFIVSKTTWNYYSVAITNCICEGIVQNQLEIEYASNIFGLEQKEQEKIEELYRICKLITDNNINFTFDDETKFEFLNRINSKKELEVNVDDVINKYIGE